MSQKKVMVPLEPTRGMVNAGRLTLKGAADSPEGEQARCVYESMVRASEAKCAKCGQTDQGQTGEYACSECGLPTVWDEVVAEEAGAHAVTCATCKHWKPSGPYETGRSLGLGSCNAAPMLWESTEWRKDKDGRVFKPEAEGITAFVQDGSDYIATLYTRAGHGCTMHAPAGVMEGRPDAVEVLQRVLRCRYPVGTSINPSGYGWDIPRLNEVVADLATPGVAAPAVSAADGAAACAKTPNGYCARPECKWPNGPCDAGVPARDSNQEKKHG